MNAKKNRKVLCIGIAAAVFVILCLVGDIGIRIYLHVCAAQNEAKREEMLYHGPWAEQSVWLSDDENAYLLSQKESDEPFAEVTAYFCMDDAWHCFQVDMTYGNTLLFSDMETNKNQFECDFSMKDDVITLSNLEAADDVVVIMPAESSFVFTKAENFDEAISQLPFNYVQSVAENE